MVAVSPRLFAEVLTGGLDQCDGVKVVDHGAGDGAEAVETFMRTRPDVALLDHVLPGLPGPEATEAIRELWPAAKVILLAGTFGADHVERALEAGAVGFLPKSLSIDQVAEAIRQAHRGQPLVFADELANLVDALDARARLGGDLHDRYASLTDPELDILEQLREGKTMIQIATSLNVSAGTLKNRMTRIFTKTGAHGRLEAIDLATKTGVIPLRRDTRG